MVWPRIAAGGALVLLAVILAVTAVPGHLLLDEGAYHLATRDLARGHGLFIENGYEGFASPELTFVVPGYSAQVAPHAGRLVSQYPYLYPLLAAPLYALAGYRALIWINCAAFAATIALVWALAARVTGNRFVAWGSAVIFAISTFAIDYAQAAMPHALSTALCTASVLAAWCAGSAPSPRAVLAWGAGAGLLAGTALATRLDSILVLPAVFLAASVSTRQRAVIGVVAGLVPPLLLVAVTNRVRFGSWSPFSYGVSAPAAQYVAKTSGIGYYAPALALAALLVLAAALVFRFRERRGWSWSIAALALGAVAAVPALRAVALRELNGVYQLGVDLRAIPADPGAPAMDGSTHAISYLGALKKAWIQSCPFLPLGVLVVGAVRSGSLARRAALLLALTPAIFLSFYAWGSWHGGLGLNLRYFSPALPFIAILVAIGLLPSTIIKNKIPLVLVINGKGIILKKVHPGEQDAQSLPEILQENLPAIDPRGFYVQLYRQKDHSAFLSLCRKEQVDIILSELKEKNFEVAGILLGSPAVIGLEPLWSDFNSIATSIHRVELANGVIDTIVGQSLNDVKQVKIDGLEFSPQYTLGFAAGLSYFMQRSPAETDDPELVSITNSHKEKNKLRFLVQVVVAIAFTLAIVNVLFYTSYFDKKNKLDAELAVYEGKNEQINKLLGDYQKNKDLIENAGVLNKNKLSEYGDKIGRTLPDEVVLSELYFNPKVENDESEDSLVTFQNKNLVLKGNCPKSFIVNEWINVLKMQKFIKEVSLERFNYNSDGALPNFEIRLITE